MPMVVNLPPGGAALRRLHTIDMAGLDPRLRAVEVVVTSDVGPQNGAGPADVEELEQALSQLAWVIARQLGVDLAGKAPWGVAQAAARAGVPVEEGRAAGFAEVHALTHLEPDVERCQRDASTLLLSLARRLAQTSPQFRAPAEAEGSGDQPAALTDSAHARLRFDW